MPGTHFVARESGLKLLSNREMHLQCNPWHMGCSSDICLQSDFAEREFEGRLNEPG